MAPTINISGSTNDTTIVLDSVNGSINTAGDISMAIVTDLINNLGFKVTNLETINLASWFGAYADANQSAFLDPFSNKTGIDITLSAAESSSNTINTELAANNVKSNIIDTLDNFFMPNVINGDLQSMPLTDFPPGSDGTPAYTLDVNGNVDTANTDLNSVPVITTVDGRKIRYAAPIILWGYHIVFKKDIVWPNGPPETAADFFNVIKYPGGRCMPNWPEGFAEIATYASTGNKDTIFNELDTPDGVDKVMDMLNLLDGNRVFYIYPPDGEVALEGGGPSNLANVPGLGFPPFSTPLESCTMGIFYTGRLYEPSGNTFYTKYGRIWDGWQAAHNYFCVPKASMNKDKSLEFIKYATSTDKLVDLCKAIPYSPLRTSAMIKLLSEIPDESIYPHSHLDKATFTNINYWQNSEHAVSIKNQYKAISGSQDLIFQGPAVHNPVNFTHTYDKRATFST